MAGFKKAKAEQAALKLGFYGAPGSGKSFTALLVAEGLAKATRKRIAVIDTEHGTDFYCQAGPSRKIHPEPFDFDALYTRSITEVVDAVRKLNTTEYAVVIVDSITHLWEACIAAYGGKKTSAGTIPMHAWGKIKAPYKDLMNILLSSSMHAIICGRQGTEYSEDENTGELKSVGWKMKAEGETPYEPHILIRMEAIKPSRPTELATIRAFIEKDRTGVLAGQLLENPTFETIAAPIMGLLSGTQARMPSADETASQDADALSGQDVERSKQSERRFDEFSARIKLASSAEELAKIGKELTPAAKSQMLTEHVSELRELYLERQAVVGG